MGIQLNAVAFQEGDLWIVQGIDYDICTRTRDVADIPLAYARAVAANVCIGVDLGRKPFEGLPVAPAQFREMYEALKTEVRSVEPLIFPGVDQSRSVNVRLSRQAA